MVKGVGDAEAPPEELDPESDPALRDVAGPSDADAAAKAMAEGTLTLTLRLTLTLTLTLPLPLTLTLTLTLLQPLIKAMAKGGDVSENFRRVLNDQFKQQGIEITDVIVTDTYNPNPNPKPLTPDPDPNP